MILKLIRVITYECGRSADRCDTLVKRHHNAPTVLLQKISRSYVLATFNMIYLLQFKHISSGQNYDS